MFPDSLGDFVDYLAFLNDYTLLEEMGLRGQIHSFTLITFLTVNPLTPKPFYQPVTLSTDSFASRGHGDKGIRGIS